MALQEYYQSLGAKKTGSTALQDYYNTLSKSGAERMVQAEQKDTGIDLDLYRRLKKVGLSSDEIRQELQPEKTSYLKQLGTTTKETFGGLGEQMIRDIRGVSQVLATPIAGALALPKGGATPSQAMKESLNMAKQVMIDKNVSIDKGVEDAAQMYLKSQGVGKYGGRPVGINDIATLGVLGFFNLFGDPAFEYGVGLRGARAFKEFAQFKKVGQVTKELEKGTSIVKGTGISREIKITDDLKVKVKPKTNEVVFEGYQKRFPKQKALPEGELSDETTDLIMKTREATGMEMSAKLQGDDLILKPTEPTPKAKQAQITREAIQPTAKTVDPLIQEAKKYKSAEEFVEAQPKLYHGTSKDFDVFDLSTQGKASGDKGFFGEGFYFTKNQQRAKQFAEQSVKTTGGKPIVKELVIDLKKPFIIDEKTSLNKIRNLASVKRTDLPTGATKADTASLIISENPKQFTNSLKKLGYDGVDIRIGRGADELLVFEPSQIKTKSQLTDIWKQAQERAGEMKKTTLGTKIAQKTIEDGLAKRFQGIPEYETVNLKNQAQMAKELLDTDIEQAKKVAMGEIRPDNPQLLPEMVLDAVERYARETDNVRLLRQLAKSDLTKEASRMGQRIRALGERDPNSPVNSIRAIEEARAKKAKVNDKEVSAEKKKIKREVKAAKKAEKDLEDFIDSIIC